MYYQFLFESFCSTKEKKNMLTKYNLAFIINIIIVWSIVQKILHFNFIHPKLMKQLHLYQQNTR